MRLNDVQILTAEWAEKTLKGRTSRKVCNNTILEKDEWGSYHIRLHHTNVVSLTSSGVYVLSSGGWRTLTTRDRLNRFGPVSVHQKNREWFLGDGTPFFDGVTISPDGKIGSLN